MAGNEVIYMTISSWQSYPSIYNIGHRAVQPLLDAEVLVEEKIDGSQFSFGIFDGEIKVRSKGSTMLVDAPEKMFNKAVQSVLERKDLLKDGWTYRAEYLAKPKHNSLIYDRVPNGNLIIFDINIGERNYLSHNLKVAEAERINLECVPRLYIGKLDLQVCRDLIDNSKSCLGGAFIEGIVIKPFNYDIYDFDKKVLLAKFVSEKFREVHTKEWKTSNTNNKDIIALISSSYTNQARWYKAIQHLRDMGQLENSPRDIGKLIKAVPEDIKKECIDDIKDQLFNWAWPQISKNSIKGFAEFYKNELLRGAFETDD